MDKRHPPLQHNDDSHFFDAAAVDGLEMLCAGDEDGGNQMAKTLKQVSGGEEDGRGEGEKEEREGGGGEGKEGGKRKGERGKGRRERETSLRMFNSIHTPSTSNQYASPL